MERLQFISSRFSTRIAMLLTLIGFGLMFFGNSDIAIYFGGTSLALALSTPFLTKWPRVHSKEWYTQWLEGLSDENLDTLTEAIEDLKESR